MRNTWMSHPTPLSSKQELAVHLVSMRAGLPAGSYAVNPATQQPIPIWVADYVLGSYGSGAIMAVPAHDTRDWAFAQQFSLPIGRVVQPEAAQEPELPLTGVRCRSAAHSHLKHCHMA